MAVNINVPSQVRTFANLAAFPASGALKTIYIAEDTNKTYRWTGSVYVEVSASASGITIGTTAITSGTVGRVLFEGTGNVVSQSANLFWDATNNRLGIGTSSPSNSLTIKTGVNDDGILLESSVGNPLFLVRKDGTSNSTAELFQYSNGSIRLAIRSASNFSYFNGGNFGFGTTTDAGFRLDVNGTARVQDDITVSRNKNQTTGVFISNTTNSASSAVAINLTSSSGEAVFAKKPALGSVYKTISGNDTYIYNGTAGDISILNDFATGRIKFAAGGASTAQMTLFSTGNLGINTTTDAGFRLDVNGTARVSGVLTSENNINLYSAGTAIKTIGAYWGGNTVYGLNIQGNASSITGTGGIPNGYIVRIGSAFSLSPTDSVDVDNVRIATGNFNPTSGNARLNLLSIFTTINQTGTANGAVRGFYYNPTVTSVLGPHWAIHTTAGRVRFEGLPTSPTGLNAGDIWNDAGTLKIV